MAALTVRWGEPEHLGLWSVSAAGAAGLPVAPPWEELSHRAGDVRLWRVAGHWIAVGAAPPGRAPGNCWWPSPGPTRPDRRTAGPVRSGRRHVLSAVPARAPSGLCAVPARALFRPEREGLYWRRPARARTGPGRPREGPPTRRTALAGTALDGAPRPRSRPPRASPPPGSSAAATRSSA
ncbi:hypothetical protein ACFQ60_11475 [Streptomyces zhihengii]